MSPNQEPYILLLEDSDDDAELIGYALANGGLNRPVMRVQTREEFMRAICTQSPEIFLSDHGLPAFDGFEALNIARHRCPKVPFIFVTGGPITEDIQSALRQGAADFVSKDNLSALVTAVARSLGTTTAPHPVPGAMAMAPTRAATVPAADQRLQLFVETIDEECAFYILDPAGRIVAWNHAARRLLGHTAAEMIGELEQRLYGEEDIRAGRAGRAPASMAPRQERGIRIRKNGTQCTVDAATTPLCDGRGEVLGLVVVLREISPVRAVAPPAHSPQGLEEAIRTIPSTRPVALDAGPSPGIEIADFIAADPSIPLEVVDPSPESTPIDGLEEATAEYEKALFEVMMTPVRNGAHVIGRALLVRLTRAMRTFDLLLARRELRLVEEAKRLNSCRRRVIEDESASKRRLHRLTRVFAEDKRAYP